MFKGRIVTFIGIFMMVFSCSIHAKELMLNNNWEKITNEIPANWRFMTYGGHSKIQLCPEKFNNKAVAVIKSESSKGRGYIGQYTKTQIPAGKTIVLSGYYRTSDIALGTKGKIYINIAYNYGSKNKAYPRKYQAMLLKPSDKWKKFEAVKALDAPVKDFFAFFMLLQASGNIYFSDLSLKVQEDCTKIDPEKKYIWREAEDINKHAHVHTWGKETKNYFSGKGGIYLDKGKCKWDFRIKEEINPQTLFPKKRNYFVWLRIYGYLEKPEASVFFNNKKIGDFKTRSNEKSNSKGEYAGPGKYYWQRAGVFKAPGGAASLVINAKGRMLIDAVLVTTDSKYTPQVYEAREASDSSFFKDVETPHAIKSVFKVYGISNKVTTPLWFKYYGKTVKVANDKKPAVFHISLPANIEIKNISSHWAGQKWNKPDRWGNKYLSWKETGSEIIDGIKHNKYEIYLYYLSLTYYVFVKAEKDNFQAGKKLSCNYYLEYNGKKQLVESLPLINTHLKATKAFKKIMIGPAGGNGRAFYEEYPEISQDMQFSGMNIINGWHLSPKRDGIQWQNFRNECIDNNISILGEYSPFYGIFGIKEARYRAVDINGKVDSHRPALAIDESSASFRKTLEHLTNQGRQGITGMVLDDENFNQNKDKFDYNQLTLEKFKKYCQEHRAKYIDPKVIINDKKKYAAEYKLWVNFKCDCLVEMYRNYKKAYLKGINESSTSSTFGEKLLIAQILKNNSPEESKINTYWDYKKLASVCDYISPMIYTYEGYEASGRVGDIVEMYNNHIGRNAIAPTLLCEHYGFGDVSMPNKVMYKYQILECLMQKSRIILFWYGCSVYNPLNSQYISEAIRLAAPYENIILNGTKFSNFSAQNWVRVKGLKLDNKILLYVANYRNSIDKIANIKLNKQIKSILEIDTGKTLKIENNSFEVNFKSDRGKLFLIKI